MEFEADILYIFTMHQLLLYVFEIHFPLFHLLCNRLSLSQHCQCTAHTMLHTYAQCARRRGRGRVQCAQAYIRRQGKARQSIAERY